MKKFNTKRLIGTAVIAVGLLGVSTLLNVSMASPPKYFNDTDYMPKLTTHQKQQQSKIIDWLVRNNTRFNVGSIRAIAPRADGKWIIDDGVPHLVEFHEIMGKRRPRYVGLDGLKVSRE